MGQACHLPGPGANGVRMLGADSHRRLVGIDRWLFGPGCRRRCWTGRRSRPGVFRLSFGGANSFATAFLGSFPILLGLSFWQGWPRPCSGLVLGALLLSPMSLFGPINGTNNGLILLGRFAFDVVQSVSTFASLIITFTAPWMMVMSLGLVTRRAWYDPEALQVFNRRQRGGRYWFDHGWNWRGLGSWLVAAVLGLSLHQHPGPVRRPAGRAGRRGGRRAAAVDADRRAALPRAR